MKSILLAFSFFSGSLIFLSSCTKQEEGPVINEATLVGKWKFTSITANGKTKEREIIPFLVLKRECDKDNIYEFKADGTMIEFAEALKCGPDSLEQRPMGTWEIIEGGKKIKVTDNIVFAGELTPLIIKEFTGNTLKVTQKTDGDVADIVEFEKLYTLTRQ